MYISQTYFSGEIAGRADVFVYYVELPGDDSTNLPKVISVFRRLGEEYASRVSLFAPDRGAVARIRSEIHNELSDYFSIEGGRETPGIIVTPRPIHEMSRKNDWVYLGLPRGSVISDRDLRQIVVGLIKTVSESMIEKKSGGLSSELKRIWDAIELKPGIFGFRFDMKKYAASRAG